MNTLLLAVILALGLHCSNAQSFVPGLETDNAVIQKAICDKHNDVRRIVDPPACDMQKMVWSKDVAANAKKAAERCGKHSSEEELKIGAMECGENIYRTTGPMPWEPLIQGWFNEYKNFTHGTGAKYQGRWLDITPRSFGMIVPKSDAQVTSVKVLFCMFASTPQGEIM